MRKTQPTSLPSLPLHHPSSTGNDPLRSSAPTHEHFPACPFPSAPKHLLSRTGLEELYLSECSGLTALPAGLGALTCLQELWLQKCTGLTALPDGLETLTHTGTCGLV